MLKKFTARRPRPRKAPVAPLQGSGTETKGAVVEAPKPAKAAPEQKPRPKELGGPSGPEPTRYGDWERKGICVDF